jgi:hypothetical protein
MRTADKLFTAFVHTSQSNKETIFENILENFWNILDRWTHTIPSR